MSKRKPTTKRAPFRIAIMGEWLTLNRSTGQAYFNVFDPERGCKVRRYMGRMLDSDGKLNIQTTDRAPYCPNVQPTSS